MKRTLLAIALCLALSTGTAYADDKKTSMSLGEMNSLVRATNAKVIAYYVQSPFGLLIRDYHVMGGAMSSAIMSNVPIGVWRCVETIERRSFDFVSVRGYCNYQQH